MPCHKTLPNMDREILYEKIHKIKADDDPEKILWKKIN